MSKLDRLTIYSVLCFISFCALMLRTPEQSAFMPILGMLATVVGIWLETHQYESHKQQDGEELD